MGRFKALRIARRGSPGCDTMNALPIPAHQVHGPDGAPCVVFVPGIGNDRTFWADQASRLTDRYRTVLFDHWGHGDSPPPPEPCGFGTVLAGLAALMDHLGIGRATLVGLGFGGSLALALAAAHPGRVEGVVACCCRPRQPDDRRAFWHERHARAGEIGMAAITQLTVDRWLPATFRAAHPAVDEALRAAMRRTSLEGYRALVAAFAEMDFTDRLGAIACPVQLVAAENDHGGGPVEAMAAMEKAIPDARLAMVPGAGHIVVAEAPEALAAIIATFLDGIARAEPVTGASTHTIG